MTMDGRRIPDVWNTMNSKVYNTYRIHCQFRLLSGFKAFEEKPLLTSESNIKGVIESTVGTAYNQASEILQQYEIRSKQSNVATLRN